MTSASARLQRLDGRPSGWRFPKAATLLATPLLLVGGWWVLATSGVFPPQILVSPGDVVTALAELARSGELQAHLGASFHRLVLGFGAGMVLGLLYGCMIALAPALDAYFGPTFTVLRGIPSIAFIPALMLVFGIGDAFKIVVIAKASFFPIALATLDGVRGVPPRIVELARAIQLPTSLYLTRVLLPATLPALVTGIRIGLARSWGVLVAAELIASEVGLGQMMELGRQMFRLDIVMAGVVIAGFVGFALDWLLRGLEQRLSRWQAA